MKKPVYVKCPRCELNYIDKKQKLCNICKAEMNQPISFFTENEEPEDSLLELCPYCKTSYITLDDEMCAKCAAKEAAEAPVPEEEDDNWRSFLDDETEDVSITTEDGVEISLSELEEEELEKDFEEDDDYFKDDEDEEEFEEEDLDDFEELEELSDDELDDLDDDEDEE